MLRYTLIMDLGTRIKQARKGVGLSQAAFSNLVGVSQPTVAGWESGEYAPGRPRMKTIARVTNVTVEWLEFGVESENSAALPTCLPGRVRIIGNVQAGVWVEAQEIPLDEQEYIETPADLRFPGIRRFGLRVVGPSMDKVFPDGSAVVCVSFEDLTQPPASGNYVAVQRRRPSGFVEATVKQYIEDATGVWLWPRSNHPQYQQPISLTDKLDEEVVITSLVIGAYRSF